MTEGSGLIEGLRAAMLGDTDGGFIDPNSDIPAGEMFRLAAEYIEDMIRLVASHYPSDLWPETTPDEKAALVEWARSRGMADGSRYHVEGIRHALALLLLGPTPSGDGRG